MNVKGDLTEDAIFMQAAHAEQQITPCRCAFGKEILNFPPHHVANRTFRGHFGAHFRGDEAPVTQHGHAVGNRKDLFHAVADKEDGNPLLAQPVGQHKELFHLVGRERRSRFIHDQDAYLERNRFGDLNGLLRGQGQPPRRAAHIQLDVELGEDRFGLAIHGAPMHNPAAVAVADKDIFGHIEVGKDHRLLVDRGNPVHLGIYRMLDRDRLAVEQDGALIGLVDARHNLDQRRFASAIFAQQRVNFTPVKGQRNILQRLGHIKALGDALHFQNWLAHHIASA